MSIYVLTNPVSDNAYTPGNLFATDMDISEAALTKLFIFGEFKESDAEESGKAGRQRIVRGTLRLPILYKNVLAQAEYIDPYNDGSRFRKNGAAVDEGHMMITQSLVSVSLVNKGDVV